MTPPYQASRPSDVSPQLAALARGVHVLLAGGCAVAIVLVRLRQGGPMSPPQIAVFYGVPALASIFFVLASRAAPTVRVGAALMVAGLLAGLYAGEATVRVLPAQGQWEGVAAELGEADARTKLQVVRDLRAAGEPAFPEYSPWQLRGLRIPLGETALVPVAPTPSGATAVACIEGQGWIVYRSDQHGFRGPEQWADETFLALIGDSFVAGRCVGDDQTIPALLRGRWPSTRNLGVAGAGPLHELAVLREYGTVLEPDVVVWVYYEGNDLADLASELASPLMTRYLEPGFRVGLPERQPEMDQRLAAALDSVYSERIELEERNVAVNPPPPVPLPETVRGFLKLTRVRELVGFGLKIPRADPLGEFPEVIRHAHESVQGWGGQLVLAYLPAYRRFGSWMGDQDAGQREAFREMAEEFGLPLVDLVDVFEEHGDPRELWVHPRGHLNPAGYEVAAAAIARVVEGSVVR